MLTEKEEKIIACLQNDLPITERPYRAVADASGLTEDEVMDIIGKMLEKGVIRRFGATLRHQKSGYSANVMVAWKVPAEKVEEAGELMARNTNISHCYQRKTGEDWPFNLYTMVHGKNRDDCLGTIKIVSEKTGISSYKLLFSKKELKKTSMKYFEDACCMDMGDDI